MSNSRSQVEAAYKNLIKTLSEAACEVDSLEGVNSQFDSIKSTVANAISAKVKEVQQECQEALNMTVWDRLVIAFFGTTNAGKSTIVETFRILYGGNKSGEDGLIVGDGQRDFTKTYDEYQLQIDGTPFTLIDVPDIEGNEREYTDKIKTALRKAHIVFYIHGENTKPNTATAAKIQKYLGDWVKVYSVYNVRGAVSNYDEAEERVTLLTDGVRKSESLIKSTFKSVLGDSYAGNVTLQAQLAMCAKANFSSCREDLRGYQRKLLSYFAADGGLNNSQAADKVLRFSQFPAVVNVVKEYSANYAQNIVEANKRKLISLSERAFEGIKSAEDEQKEKVDDLESQLDKLRTSIDGAVRTTCSNIRVAAEGEVRKKHVEFKNSISACIDNGKDTNYIRERVNVLQRDLVNELSCSISYIVKSEVDELEEKVDRKIGELDGVLYIPSIRTSGVGCVVESIDFSGAFISPKSNNTPHTIEKYISGVKPTKTKSTFWWPAVGLVLRRGALFV